MPHATQDLSSWHPVDPAFMIERLHLRGEQSAPPSGDWYLHRNISPLDLYCYLKARFGPPNGFAMTLRSPSADNLIHWHWSLQCGDQLIEFMGYNLHAMAVIDGADPTPEESTSFVASIKADFRNHGPAMKSVKKELERWSIFTNPYYRLRGVVNKLRTELLGLAIDKIELPPLPTTEEELMRHDAIWSDCATAYSKALGLGLSMRMVAPVLAESFVNLLIFLLAKPELREDERLYKNALRQEIDIRVKTLHMTCVGFARQVDAGDAAFKGFHTLMNSRNDFLHGNIDPLQLQYDVVHFDGTIPLPEAYKSMADIALANSLIGVEPPTALKDVEIVDAFIQMLLECLESDARPFVEAFMQAPNPGWRADIKRAGILFSPRVTHVVYGKGDRPERTPKPA